MGSAQSPAVQQLPDHPRPFSDQLLQQLGTPFVWDGRLTYVHQRADHTRQNLLVKTSLDLKYYIADAK